MFDKQLFQDLAPLLGRVMLGLLFIMTGYDKITGFEGYVDSVAAKGVPLPEIAIVVVIIVELVGGLMIAAGLKSRWAALAIFLLIIPINFFYHPFWADDAQFNRFFKNLCVMGGMLYVMASGPWRLSLTRD